MHGRFRLLAVVCCLPFAGSIGVAEDLAIDRAVIQQIEDGPPIEGGYEFLPGETAYLSFRVSGFEAKAKDDDFRSISLQYTIEITDPGGIPAIPKFSGVIKSDLREEDKDWTPKVRRELMLPDFAARGKYKILLWVKDELSGGEARRELGLTVRNRDVAPSAELVIRNFGFFRTENDRRSMGDAPAYPAGEPVVVKFDATGYQLGPKNALFVEYGLKLTGPDDKTVIDQPLAAAEQFESFYPRRWLPVSFRLDLPKDPAKGAYVLTIQLRDKIAGKNLELGRSFHVE